MVSHRCLARVAHATLALQFVMSVNCQNRPSMMLRRRLGHTEQSISQNSYAERRWFRPDRDDGISITEIFYWTSMLDVKTLDVPEEDHEHIKHEVEHCGWT